MGQTVRFETCPGRNLPIGFLYYGVLRGLNNTSTFAANNCTPTSSASGFTYTLTRADVGWVTVSELAGRDLSATPPRPTDTYDIRNYRVYDNVPPAFSVASCSSDKARVTITDVTYDRYEIQAGSNPVVNVVPRQPRRPEVQDVDVTGTTSITVRGYYSEPGACGSQPATQTIAPLPAPQTPLLTTFTLNAPLPNGSATLAVGQLPAGYLYTLQRTDGNGGYIPVASVPAGSPPLLLSTVVDGSGYRLRRTAVCTNVDSAFSPLLYPINLSGTSARKINQLIFRVGGTPPDSYSVTRDGAPITGFTVIPGVGLEDATGECNTTYRYQVTANYGPTPGYPNGRKSISNEFDIKTQSDLLPPQPRLLASFNLRNVVELTPLLATNGLAKGSTLYYRKATNGPLAPFATTADPRPARDSTALADLRAAPPCYSLRQADACNNTSPESASICPALLSAGPADADGSTAVLTWTPFTGPDPSIPAVYVLQRLGPDYAVLPGSVPVTGGTYTDLTAPTNRQVLRYRLQISGAGLSAGTFSYSNIATVTRQLFLTIPTAFTPNGDGLNDVLEVKGKYLDNYTFVVVDRNGQEVFRGSKRADVWDGTIRGHAPAMGSYVWRFSQNNEDGSPFTATGAVTILK